MIHRITVNTHVETEMSFALVPTRVHFVGRRGCAGGVKEMPRDNRYMYMKCHSPWYLHECIRRWEKRVPGGEKEMPRDNRYMYMVYVCFMYVVVRSWRIGSCVCGSCESFMS